MNETDWVALLRDGEGWPNWIDLETEEMGKRACSKSDPTASGSCGMNCDAGEKKKETTMKRPPIKNKRRADK